MHHSRPSDSETLETDRHDASLIADFLTAFKCFQEHFSLWSVGFPTVTDQQLFCFAKSELLCGSLCDITHEKEQAAAAGPDWVKETLSLQTVFALPQQTPVWVHGLLYVSFFQNATDYIST